MQILTLPSQYIFSLLVFAAKHRDLFLSNSDIHNINTCYNDNLHLPTTNLTLVQKGVLYSESKIYNNLPPHIKDHSEDLKYFKSKLKGFLIEHTLYSLEEFYQVTSKRLWFLLVFYFIWISICIKLVWLNIIIHCFCFT